jgi:hypothetical protein
MERAKQLFLGNEDAVRDEVFKLITHLHAQTLLICGEGLENFSNHNDEIRSNYLWSICDLAERSLHLLSQLRAPDSVVKAG